MTTMGKRTLPVSAAPLKRAKVETVPAHSPDMSDREDDDGEDEVEEVEDEEDEDEGEEEKEEDDEEQNVDDKEKTTAKTHPKARNESSSIQVARETAELFKSNIFKLQIDELLKETRVKDTHIARIEKVLHRLHEMISKVPDSGPLSLEEATLKKAAIPFPDPKPTKLSYTLEYRKPQNISIVGSFGLKTGTSGASTIDVALTMPESLFQAKDYLNYRALYKRAFYVAYLAERLIPLSKEHHLPVKIEYRYLNGDVLCPVLHLTSINTKEETDLVFDRTHFGINVLVGFPHAMFDSKKLLPDKNCIRIESDSNNLPPTPLYNASILSMASYDYYLKYLYTTKKQTAAFKEACILSRFWLRKHGFGSSFEKGGFGHFEMAVLMAALLEGGGKDKARVLLHGFSSYQLFKATVAYLASVDLSSGYLAFSSLVGEPGNTRYSPDGWGFPTLFDRNIRLNILWKMSPASYSELRSVAAATVNLLSDNIRDRFDAVLLQQAHFPLLRWDVLFEVDVPEHVELNAFGPHEKISFLTFANYAKSKVHAILSKALGDRVNLISVTATDPPAFSLLKRRPPVGSLSLSVGLTLNPQEADKLVSKGPPESPDSAEDAARFRAFWGKRASLRRFKDGAVQHCVVWENSSDPLVVTISKEALLMHLGHPHVSYESALAKLPTPVTYSGASITSTANYTRVRAAFETLAKTLSSLDLPLKIRAVNAGAAPALRGTSILQPVPFATAQPDFWNDVVVQFESSVRWPDEMSSLENTKTAFLVKILRELSTYKAYITADTCVPFGHGKLLHILSPDGFGFRLRILTEKDEALYLHACERAQKDRAPVQDAYLRFAQTFIGAVKHARTVSSLSAHYSYYSGTCRLFKAWLDSQLLLCHFTDELVDILALKVFVDPAPFSVPNSVENGFLQILTYLSHWNWKDDPLILDLVRSDADLDDRLSSSQYALVEANFRKIRAQDPSAFKTQLFVGSKDDPSGILWSTGLSLPIASRLTALCRMAMGLVKRDGLSSLDVLFTPALSDFDFVIHTKQQALSTGVLPKDSFKNLAAAPTSYPSDLASASDLVHELYSDLNRKLGNLVIFSTHRVSDKNVIGGVFIPAALGNKKFRANLGLNVMPEGDGVVVNRKAVMEQVALLGGDLIDKITEKELK